MGKILSSMDTRTSDNKENTTLIWFDPNIGTYEDTEQTKKELRQINDYVVFHTELDPCVAYIRSIDKQKIFLITSGSRASELLPQVIALRQVDSIFIFCMKKTRYEHLTDEYPKIIGLFVDLDSLCASIREEVDLVNKQLETFSFFDQHQQSTKDLSEQSAEFLWFQLFNDVIMRLPRNAQAKRQMINMCRQYYRGNSKQQKLIDEFERDYRPEEAIRWYSKQSFVYKLVNNALRSEDIDQLHTVRFFVGDLSENLAREHQNILDFDKEILTVYRGAKLATEEFDKIKQNKGKLISTNGFLSTSRLRSLAFEFAIKPTKRTDVVSVLFVIECNVQRLGQSVIFADIAKFSDYPDEKEILFDLSAAFRLESIRQEGTLWLINMTASSEGQTITKDYIELQRRETEERSVAIMFGRLMCNMGQYEKSQKYFEQLLSDPNGEDLAWIEFNIGRALGWKGEWVAARKWYDSAYIRMMNAKPPRIKDSALVLINIGIVLNNQGKYDEALDFYRRALTMQEKFYPAGHVDIATSLNSIGSALRQQGKYDEALDLYRRALTMRKKFYPSGHVDIARSLNNIGCTLYQQGKYDQALDFYRRALTRLEKFYPSGHVDIARSLNNIGSIRRQQGKYDEGLDLYRRALTMQEKFYSSGHVDIARSLNSIGCTLHQQRKYDEALDFYRRALTMQEKFYPSGHVNIATILNNIGLIHLKKYQYDHALDYLERSLRMKEQFLSDNHPDIVDTLNSIGIAYENLQKSKMALDCYKRALTIYEKTLPIGHPNRRRTEQKIRRLCDKE